MQSATNNGSGIRVQYRQINEKVAVSLPGSKSISNRLLVLQSLSGFPFKITGLSQARDTMVLKALLNEKGNLANVKDAGTAARFGLAWACVKNKAITLSGTDRLHKRPMEPLIDALRQLGFEINELGKPGYFPVRVNPVDKKRIGRRVTIKPEVSSQFISALCLIGPFLPKGLSIQIVGEVPSVAYVNLTLELMRNLGFRIFQESKNILIEPQPEKLVKSIYVEPDWSSAAFWYEYVALSGNSVLLRDLKLKSSQGDSCCSSIFKTLGVQSIQTKQGVEVSKFTEANSLLAQNFQECPDLAQPVLFSCVALGIKCEALGLQTLKYKETDRISAIMNEFRKLNAEFSQGNGGYFLNPGKIPNQNMVFESYDDHRMVMSEVMLLPTLKSLKIKDPQVVQKSYPRFWEEANKVGIKMDE